MRIETTINHPEAFQSYRASESDPDGPKSWRPMRKGVADMHRRAEVSQQANDRYAETSWKPSAMAPWQWKDSATVIWLLVYIRRSRLIQSSAAG